MENWEEIIKAEEARKRQAQIAEENRNRSYLLECKVRLDNDFKIINAFGLLKDLRNNLWHGGNIEKIDEIETMRTEHNLINRATFDYQTYLHYGYQLNPHGTNSKSRLPLTLSYRINLDRLFTFDAAHSARYNQPPIRVLGLYGAIDSDSIRSVTSFTIEEIPRIKFFIANDARARGFL